ncbi:MAG: hypothetical protein AB7K09_11550 [Planctomycetota bacterium]
MMFPRLAFIVVLLLACLLPACSSGARQPLETRTALVVAPERSAVPGGVSNEGLVGRLLQRLHAEPDERDVVAARAAIVDLALDTSNPGTPDFYRIVTEKQRLDARSVFGLTREERFLSENLRRVLLQIGSPRSLQALRPEASDLASIAPLLTWAAARLDPDERRRAIRHAQIEAAVNLRMRSLLAGHTRRLLDELSLWLSPDPARPMRMQVMPAQTIDRLTLEAPTREALDHALADSLREIPGLEASIIESPLSAGPSGALLLQVGVNGLCAELLDPTARQVLWAGVIDWWPSDDPWSVARRLAEADRRASDMALAMEARSLDSGDRGPAPARVLCGLVAFTTTDEGAELARAVRQRVLAAVSRQRRLRIVDFGGDTATAALGSRPEQSAEVVTEPGLRFVITGSVQGKWERGRFVGRLSLSALDLRHDMHAVWQAELWSPSTPNIDNGALPQ